MSKQEADTLLAMAGYGNDALTEFLHEHYNPISSLVIINIMAQGKDENATRALLVRYL